MSCCDFERHALTEAIAARSAAEMAVADYSSKLAEQQAFVDKLYAEYQALGGAAAAVLAEKARAAWEAAKAALVTARVTVRQAYEAARALQAQYAAEQAAGGGTITAAMVAAAWDKWTVATAAARAAAANVSATAVAYYAAAAAAVAAVAALSMWLGSQARLVYLRRQLTKAKTELQRAKKAVQEAQREFDRCRASVTTCAKCSKCVEAGEVRNCGGCGGDFCNACFSEWIEEQERLRAIGGG